MSEPERGGSATRPVALVTGGSRGIGRAVVEALAGAGHRVYFGSKNPASVDRALTEMGEMGAAGGVAGRALDVRRQDEVEAFIDWVAGREGRIDCLVNNAGLGLFGPVDQLPGERWREVLETNLSGAFYCLQAAARVMKAQGSGWIINIGSLAGRNAFAGGAAYNASKFGLIGLSEAAMLDLRPSGIRVAAILPGSVDTGFGDRNRHPGEPGDHRPDRSWMLAPQDVAAMVMHLISYPDRALPSLIEMRPSRPPGAPSR